MLYSNKQVDGLLAWVLKANDPAKKTRLYKAAQDITWQESLWIPLVVEKPVSTHNKSLAGFWIMPGTGFGFEDADLQQAAQGVERLITLLNACRG